MKRNNIYLLSFVFIAALFASCSTSEDEVTAEKSTANLNISTDINQTRAIITATNFSAKDSIGVFVTTDDGGIYAQNGSNARCVYDGSKWNFPDGNVLLSTSSAKVYSYYPYTKGTSANSVPVSLMATRGASYTDYLYGSSTGNVDAVDSVAQISFKHALALVTFQIPSQIGENNEYHYEAYESLSNVGKGTAISISGTMNAITGVINPKLDSAACIDVTKVYPAVEYSKRKESITRSGTGTNNVNFLVIPTQVKNDVVFKFALRTSQYINQGSQVLFNIVIPKIQWEAGKQYIYPVTITNNSTATLATKDPSVRDWTNTTEGTTTISNDNVDTLGTVGSPVDLGLSVKWADHNVGATSPEDYGGYFAWGETATKTNYTESTSEWYKVSNSSLYQGVIDSNGRLTATYDAATVNWGKSWRMPTQAELKELITKCTWTWTTSNSIHGYKVVGTNGNSIFLPAAGFRYESGLYGAGSGGFCWSSIFYFLDGGAYGLDFSSGHYDWDYDHRYRGNSVRPVTE